MILLIDLVPFHLSYAALSFTLEIVCQLLGPNLGVLAESEIRQFNVSCDIKQDVIRLEIPMDVLHLMH